MNRRFDHRDKETFSKDIKRATLIENWLMSLWSDDMSLRGYPIEYVPYAEGRDGKYLAKASSKSDYLVTLAGKESHSSPTLLEVKTHPYGSRSGFSTFKVDALTAALKERATILLFFSISTRSDDFKALTDLGAVEWTLILPEVIEAWFSEYEPQKFGYGTFGNKDCIRILREDYDRWITIEKLLF